jgi:hypothetical protein
MSEIERESFIYEQLEKVWQKQLLMKAVEYSKSNLGKKDSAPFTNTYTSDPPKNDSSPSVNLLPTLAAAAESSNLDEIKARLQAAEVVLAANTKRFNRVRAKFRASRRDVDELKRMLEEAQGNSGKSNVVTHPSPNQHNQHCYYRPFCKRMTRDCGGWTRTGCEDYRPKDKYGREGPKRKELPGGTDGAEFGKMKKEFDAPKLREIAKNSMRKKRDLQKATENPSKKKK